MPTYSSSKIARLSVKNQAAWGTADTTFMIDLECEVPSFDFPTELLEIDSIRSGFFSPPPIAGARSNGTLSFKMRMHGWSTNNPGISDNPDEHADSLMLKYALGANLSDNYSATGLESGSSTTALNVTDGEGAAMVAGGGCLIPVAGGHGLGVIKSASVGGDPDVVTLAYPTQATVASSGAIYGTNTVYLSTGLTPLTFLWTGQNEGEYYTLSDCVVESVSISCSPAGHLEVDYSCKVGNWTQTPAGPGLSAGAGYSVTDPYLPVAVGRSFGSLATTDGSTNVELPVGDLSITITNTLIEAKQFAASEGIAQYILADRNVSMSLTIPTTDALTTSAWADLVGTTGDAVRYELGNTPGRIFGIYVPAPFYKSITAEDQGGLHGLSVDFGVGTYSGDTALASEATANTDFRIFFG